MKLSLRRRESAYHIPRAAVICAAFVVVLWAVAAWSGAAGPLLCPFRTVTGLPCPTCGLTRAAHSIMHGDVAGAFALNPMAAVLVLAAGPAAAVGAVTNRRGWPALRLDATRGERFALRGLLAVLVLANWVYVLFSAA